jgi:hypothetical protein
MPPVTSSSARNGSMSASRIAGAITSRYTASKSITVPSASDFCPNGMKTKHSWPGIARLLKPAGLCTSRTAGSTALHPWKMPVDRRDYAGLRIVLRKLPIQQSSRIRNVCEIFLYQVKHAFVHRPPLSSCHRAALCGSDVII